MSCINCARGFHDECIQDPCCCPPDRQESESQLGIETLPVGRPRKEDDEISTSAGRKRAAAEYEIDKTAACEWSGRADCGGGKTPIVGCLGNTQAHRHHGPIKHTAHNERGNVHKICARCHNTWHAKNDPIYDEQQYASLPHNPRKMTKTEAFQQAMELLD
jgi:hypothetical protein